MGKKLLGPDAAGMSQSSGQIPTNFSPQGVHHNLTQMLHSAMPFQLDTKYCSQDFVFWAIIYLKLAILI